MLGASRERIKDTVEDLCPALLIAALVAWHAIHNWLWLTSNSVLTGWDKARHLAQSLTYNNLLTPLTLRTLFNALISDTVRPPLAPMSAVILVRLFGVSGDVATMVNVLWMTVTLAATWKAGVQLSGRRLAFLSVVLLALFPMFYAMSRYFYLEFPLTALAAVTMCLLLASDGFRKRGVSLGFGLCLGLGLLTKRTYVAFVFAPILLMVLTSGVLPSLWLRLRGGLRVDLKDAVLALAVGLALAAVWVFPNWDTVRHLTLGGWLYPLWAGLAAVTFYLMRRRPGPDVNSLSALALGVTIGSLWYLANPSFLQRMLLFAYGVNDPRGRTIGVGSLSTYTDYLVVLVNQHISLFVLLVLGFAALLVLVLLLRQRQLLAALRQIQMGWWAVILWVLGPYLVLTLSIYHEARAITPVLPAIALLGGGLLLKLPKKLATVLLVVLIAGAVVQFQAISFEPLHGLVEATSVRLPLLGETSLLGWGGYLQRPDAAATDHRYWVQPDILQRMEQQRVAQQWDNASLGLLVNTNQINFEHFAYLTLSEGYYPQITVERLARAHGEEAVYPRLFRHDYLLVKRYNAAVDADSQAIINQILDDPPALFLQVFEVDKSYPLPDGDVAYLYRRRERPPNDVAADSFPALAQALNGLIRDGDAVVVIPPSLLPLLGQHMGGDLHVYALPAQDPPEQVLAAVSANHHRVWAIYGGGDALDLDASGRRWLNEHSYRAWDAWFGPTQMVLYGTPSAPELPLVQPVGADLGEMVTLVSFSLQENEVQATSMLALSLFWRARGPIDKDYKVFVHLVNGAGQLITQRDSEPAAGLRPTSTWVAGEIISDRVGLLLPAGMPPAEVKLLVGMYDPATLQRLPLFDASGQAIGDSISLGTVRLPGIRP